MFKRIAKLVAPVALAAGLLVGGTAVAAHASTGSGNQWQAVQVFNGPFVNGWGGGPDVNVYNGRTTNNDFQLMYNTGESAYQLEFEPYNGAPYGFDIIADLGNDKNDARAGLYTPGIVAPWGGNWTPSSCSVAGAPGYYFKNNHWGGYLAPSGSGNGAAFYLNSASKYCFIYSAPA